MIVVACSKHTWVKGRDEYPPNQLTLLNSLETGVETAASASDTHAALTAAHGATGAVVGTTNSQTLTNKTISGSSNTFSNIPASAVKADSWTSYTPTWTSSGTAPAIGNSTVSAAYYQIGKRVDFTINVTFGSTATYGTGYWRWSLPVTPHATRTQVFSGIAWDASSSLWYPVPHTIVPADSATSTQGWVHLTTGTYGSGTLLSATAPFTWTTSDTLAIHGSYEAS